MIRVGFVLKYGEEWMGGINYFKNLLRLIYLLPDRRIEPVIFTEKKTATSFLNNFPNIEIVVSGLITKFNPGWIIRQGCKYVFAYDWFLERLLLKHNISVLSHSGYIGTNARIFTIGWIPDFQHLRLPGFFSKKEINDRNKRFARLCKKSSCILLSSYASQKDLADFLPLYVPKSRILQFTAGFSNVENTVNLKSLEMRYEFKGQYFYISNQFWIHKNHRVVIEALQILKSSNRKVLVLATGNTHDYRQPYYFDSLIEYAKQCDVLDCFNILGIVPYTDVMALMQNSVSLINPSLFEGWSTVVEEAKSIGKRIILSDIAVHREQQPPGGVFFDPRNAQELAEIMWRLWKTADIEEENKLLEDAKRELPERQCEVAKKFENIVLELVNMAN